MKTLIKYFTLIISTILIVSCTSDMVTVIRDDGSCYREFSAQADSAFVFGDKSDSHNPFPVQLDSNWHIAFIHRNIEYPLRDATVYDSLLKSEDGDQLRRRLTVVARRDYQSVDEMAALFRLKESHAWSDWKINYSFEKKFRWFYTYFHYRETYPKVEHSLHNPPIHKYLNEEEQQFWFTGTPHLLQGMNGMEACEFTKELEEKYSKWLYQNAWNAAYQVLIENYDKIKLPPTSKERLEALRDTIFLRSEFEAKDSEWNMEQCLNDYFHTQQFSGVWNMPDSPMKQFEKEYFKQDFMKYFEEAFVYRLVMPGTIRQTGNAVVQNDTLVWQLTAWRMLFDDYSIEACSRKTNSWAFVVAGIIFVIAVAAFRYRKKRANLKFALE